MTRRWLLAVIALVILLDQATKHWALTALEGGRTIEVVWTLRFSLGFNSGFAFGNGRGWGGLIGSIALIVTIVLLRAMARAASTVLALGLGLVSGGAMGNLVDRIFRGEGWMRGRVVDFIDLQWWPVFNVADSAITVGAVLIVIGTLLELRDERRVAGGVER